MKIYRTINGIKFSIELLPEELSEAYFEQQTKFDIEDVIMYGESFDNIETELGCTYSEFLALKEDIAREMRRNIDKYDMEWTYARDEAVRDVLSRKRVAV